MNEQMKRLRQLLDEAGIEYEYTSEDREMDVDMRQAIEYQNIVRSLNLELPSEYPVKAREIPPIDESGSSIYERVAVECGNDEPVTAVFWPPYTYGSRAGLLEAWDGVESDVTGWLTAEEAFEYIKERTEK